MSDLSLDPSIPPTGAASPIKLPFQITYCSSHDDRYPPTSLTPSPTSPTPSLHGWQSARGAPFPQSLALSFGGLCELRKVQLLSHQSKIAKTVELHVGTAVNAEGKGGPINSKRKGEEVEWSRLGSVNPSPPPPHNPSATESVPINAHGSYLKLVLKSCHSNPLNPHHQVSIVALHILGLPLTPLPFHPSPPHPPLSLSHLSPTPQLPPELDLTSTQYLLHLSQLKAQAIDAEDYDQAKTMKERMERLMGEVPKLVEMERRKREAIEREDYDEAKQCKREVERIRERALMQPHPHPDERKERGESSVRRNSGREAQAPSEAAATPRSLLDDDRPIKPAKSAAVSVIPHNEVAVGVKKNAVVASADDESTAFPVHAGDDRGAVGDEASAFAPSSNGAVYDEDRPIKTKYQPPVEVVSPRRGNKAGDAGEDRAINGVNSAYPFDPSALPPSPSSSALPTPEPIPASLSKEAEPLVVLFGSLLTSQLLSRHWQLRAEALSTIATLVGDPASPVREGGAWVREVGRVLQRVMADKVVLVFIAGARLLEVLMKEAGKKGSGGKEELKGVIEGIVKVMVDRLSSSNARERDQAVQVLLYLALHKHSTPSIIAGILLHPLKKKDADNPTPLRGRLLLLHSLILRFGMVEAAGLTVPAVMRLIVPLLSHRDAGVRDAAFNVVASACMEGGVRVKVEGYLKEVPPAPLAGVVGRIEDVMEGQVVFQKVEVPTLAYVERPLIKETAATASVVSPRRRGEDLKEREEAPLSARKEKGKWKAVGRQSEPPLSARSNNGHDGMKKSPRDVRVAPHSEGKRTRGGRENQSETEGSQEKVRRDAKEEKGMAGKKKGGGQVPRPTPSYTEEEEVEEEYIEDSIQHLAVPNAGSPSQYRLTHAAPSPPSPAPTSPPPPVTPPLSPVPTQCQFCGLEDPSFTEDALDLHYWQACPMLLSCPHCEQVVEIPTFGEHLMGECEGGQTWKACEKCGWVVEERGVEEHQAECGGVKPGNVVCQLCCKESEGTEEGWRKHLLDDTCHGNTRTAGLDVTVTQ